MGQQSSALEDVGMIGSKVFADAFQGRRVLLTGHTGFKGSWLATWLIQLGAEVHGIALNPEPHATLFDQAGLIDKLSADHRVDVRDESSIAKIIADTKPEYVFHLAAQPLVRLSFDQPLETFSTNVMGTANVLESVRRLESVCHVVVVTTDKCYENREWLSSYREQDAMGGHDPYSASKGCAELVTSSYRRSFFSDSHGSSIASARAGNVIGGGDWATDRIIPDIFRAVQAGKSVPVRNRLATRPWQHVLEPLSGYLWLAAALGGNDAACHGRDHQEFRTAFNFGPALTSNRTVSDVVEAILGLVGGQWEDRSDPDAPHEASKLNLAIDRAFHLLRWTPVWSFDKTIAQTVDFYQRATDGDVPQMMEEQIDHYCHDASQAAIAWATCGATC